MKIKFIVFDTETNGMSNCSLLSISALKLEYDFDTKTLVKVDEYDRYYYKEEGEPLNYFALKVHGLDDYTIKKRRGQNDYPLYFSLDIDSFISFTKGIKHFVAHNISFDEKFIPFNLPFKYCTMLKTVDLLKIKGNKGVYKWPKLSELANFYNVPFKEDKLHGSLYDTIILGRIIYRMLKTEESRINFEKFLRKG